MTKQNTFKLGLSAIILLCLALALTEGVFIPKQLQPDALPLKFKEFRNIEDKVMAVFEMQNLSASQIVVWENAEQIIQENGADQKLEVGIQRTVIKENESAELLIPVPAESPWQAVFQVAPFDPKQKRLFESGKSIDGTLVYSPSLENPPVAE